MRQSFRDGTEHIKVLDFGIAKIRRPDGTPTKLTGLGMALSTPYYMSQSRRWAKRPDFRSDLYALGCILYQLLSGQLPFDAEQPMAVLHSSSYAGLRHRYPRYSVMATHPSDGLRHPCASLMSKPDDRPDSTDVADRLADCVSVPVVSLLISLILNSVIRPLDRRKIKPRAR